MALGTGLALAGASLVGGLASSGAQYGANAALQEDAQVFNAEEAQKQRDWQNMMSSTAYQRQVADMKAAGLSPALLYAGGASGASSSGGSSASSPRASVGSPNMSAFNAFMDYINKDRDFDHKLALEREKASFRANELDKRLDAYSSVYKRDSGRKYSKEFLDSLISEDYDF